MEKLENYNMRVRGYCGPEEALAARGAVFRISRTEMNAAREYEAARIIGVVYRK